MYQAELEKTRKRRDSKSILYKILKNTIIPTSKTKICGEVELNFKQSKKYFQLATDKELLSKNIIGLYETTPKGLDYIEKYKNCKSVSEHLENLDRELMEMISDKILPANYENETERFEKLKPSDLRPEYLTAKNETTEDEKRNMLEIMLKVLEKAKTPTKKTETMYSTRLNFYQIGKYLNLLLDIGMIEELQEKKTQFRFYKTTEKGHILLGLFENYSEKKEKLNRQLGWQAD